MKVEIFRANHELFVFPDGVAHGFTIPVTFKETDEEHEYFGGQAVLEIWNASDERPLYRNEVENLIGTLYESIEAGRITNDNFKEIMWELKTKQDATN